MSQIFKLKNGTLFLVTEAPGGIYNSLQLKKIAELCNRDLAIVKATEDQRLGLFIKEDEAAAVAVELESVGLGFRNYQQGLHQPVSCVGELCEDHEQDALGSAMDITKEIANIQLGSPLKIGVNGCYQCCTPCHTLDISIIGEALGYRISLGGKGSQIPELAAFMAESVPAEKLPGMIRNLVQIYHDHAESGESLLDVIDRCGVGKFVKALAPYSQDASHSDDPLAVEKQLVLAGDEDSDTALDDQQEQDEDHPAIDDDLDEAAFDSLADDFNETKSIQQEQDLVEDNPILDDESLDITEDEDLDQPNDATFEDSDSMLPQSDESDLEEDLSPIDEAANNEHLPEDEALCDDEAVGDESEEIPIQSKDQSSGLGQDAIGLETEEIIDDDVFSGEDFDFDDEDLESEASDDSHSTEEDLTEEEKAFLDSEDLDLNPIPTGNVHKIDSANDSSEVEDPLAEDFGDAEGLSEEDELNFEHRLNESIDEEVKLIASEEKDVNELERQATLGMLESGNITGLKSSDTRQKMHEAARIDESTFENLDDDELQPIAHEDIMEVETTSEDYLNVAKVVSEKSSRSLHDSVEKSRTTSRSLSRYFKFSGMDLVDQDKIHLSFESGAYIDIDLSSLAEGEEKAFSLGAQSFVVVRTREGYLLEVQGVRLFYPHVDMQQAS